MNPDIPAPLEKSILKCLEREPDKRYPIASVLVYDLKAASFIFSGTDEVERSRRRESAQIDVAVKNGQKFINSLKPPGASERGFLLAAFSLGWSRLRSSKRCARTHVRGVKFGHFESGSQAEGLNHSSPGQSEAPPWVSIL